MFRQAMKRAVQSAMRLGAKGIKVEVRGTYSCHTNRIMQIGYREARLPPHTLRPDIDTQHGRRERN